MALSDVYNKRQIEVLRATLKTDWFIALLHGAKRSGKTKINNDLFLFELRRVRKIADREGVKEPMYILAGVSSATIQKNVLQELYNTYNIEPKYDKHGNFKLFGVKVVQAYTGNIGGLGAIRGMTAYGAYINEASLSVRSVFGEIVSRCSGTGARILADTNPDNPEHWLKKDYIDQAGKNPNILEFRFILDDNMFLSERYRENIKEATPMGVFYDRDILGLWVLAEGAIYQDFDKKTMVIDLPEETRFKQNYVSIDYGTQNATVFKLWGNPTAYDFWYCRDEYYYSGRESRQQKTDSEYADDLEKFYQERGLDKRRVKVILDPSAASFKAEILKRGFQVKPAKNNVINGIRCVASNMKSGNIKWSPKCVHTIKEFNLYVWDEAAANRGEDAPIKENDHCMDADRYFVYTVIGKSTQAKIKNRPDWMN